MVVMHRILSLSPDDAPALRDRGLLAARLGAISQAKADLTRSIEVGKDPGLLAQTRSDLARLEKKRTSLN
jgi:regulator of sirC expression with transglutaminase-like and TPR domain